ncbi:MAG: DUF805 domain-containing protein [Verrucomicrobia bacterium]|nr:DUF805 domain-containing protein [Verrucomicrobiota bacterium]
MPDLGILTLLALIGGLFVPKGRRSRMQYFGCNLLNIAISAVLGFVGYGLISLFAHEEILTSSPTTGEPIEVRFAVATYLGVGLLVYLTFILICKRLHDMGLSAWFAIPVQLLLLVPWINVVVGLVLLFCPSKNDPGRNANRYGTDPRS